MRLIKCPHCGHLQEPYPYIRICSNCYADIEGLINEYFKKKTSHKESERKIETSEGKLGVQDLATRVSDARDFKVSGGKLTPFSTILKKTIGTLIKKFLTLYPLAFISLFFFMLIGIFTSIIGIHTFFPEVYPKDPRGTSLAIAGIICCLFISLYGQAALIFGVSNAASGFGGAIVGAGKKVMSYVLLVLLLMIGIVIGFGLYFLPGIILIVMFAFSPFVLIAESETVWGALSKNIIYMKGMWLPVILRLSLIPLALILSMFCYAYSWGFLAKASQSAFTYILFASALFSPLIALLAVYIFMVYEDLRLAKGIVLTAETEGVQITLIDETPEAATVSPQLLSVSELFDRSWELYKKRFVTITALNLISYTPHIINLSILFVSIFLWTRFCEAFEIRGDYGLLWFAMLLQLSPKLMIVVIAALIIFFILHVLTALCSFVLYVDLELAYVYAAAEDQISVFEAIGKAKKRLRQFVWPLIYTNFTISNGFMLLVPGLAFMVWYAFTPYVYALERDEDLSMLKSREYVKGLWSHVFKILMAVRFMPLLFILCLLLFIYGVLPFYWILGSFLSIFGGINLPGMFLVYGKVFWNLLAIGLFVGTTLFYLPFQKVFLYVAYKELKDLKDMNN
jgi:hypothetical protein